MEVQNEKSYASVCGLGRKVLLSQVILEANTSITRAPVGLRACAIEITSDLEDNVAAHFFYKSLMAEW